MECHVLRFVVRVCAEALGSRLPAGHPGARRPWRQPSTPRGASSAAKHSKHTTQTSTARTWASLWSLVAAAATPTTRSGQPCASPGSDLAGAAPASATQLARAHRRHLYRMPLCLGEWMREQGVERRPDLAPPRGPDRSIAWRPRARRQGGAFHSHPVVREILLEVAAWCASTWSVMFSAGS